MSRAVALLDRYLLRETVGTLFAVLALVMSLMVLEHLPRLIEITRLSGHRGYIVAQTVAGLLPEYAGVGLLVGLYLAVALAIRKLTLRSELDAIEAVGIGPRRWMRVPLALTAIVSALILWNQGWLMPGGETRLSEIGRRMDAGDFGYNLKANQFIDLGDGRTLSFQGVSDDGRHLVGIFLDDEDTSYSAASGRFSINPGSGDILVELVDARSVRKDTGRTASFQRLVFQGRRTPVNSSESPKDEAKQDTLADLFAQPTAQNRATAYGRLLWPMLALLSPILALAVARPPMRSTSALGLMLGLVLLVSCIKTIALVTDQQSAMPEFQALLVLGGWIAGALVLLRLNWVLGKGFIDAAIVKLFNSSKKRLLRSS